MFFRDVFLISATGVRNEKFFSQIAVCLSEICESEHRSVRRSLKGFLKVSSSVRDDAKDERPFVPLLIQRPRGRKCGL